MFLFPVPGFLCVKAGSLTTVFDFSVVSIMVHSVLVGIRNVVYVYPILSIPKDIS